MSRQASQSVPSLDELARHPDRALGLTPDVARATFFRALIVQQACLGVFAGGASEEPGPVDTLDQALTVDQAAGRLGMSPITLYKRAQHPPLSALRIDTGTRQVRFSARRIQDFLAGRVRPEGLPTPPRGRRKGVRMPRRPPPPPPCVRRSRGEA
jgi:hypothetical protein